MRHQSRARSRRKSRTDGWSCAAGYHGPGPGRVEAINISRGGVPKLPVFEAFIAEDGLGGDHQNDSYHHGGPDRAVVVYSLDVIRALQREGHPISAGAVG